VRSAPAQDKHNIIGGLHHGQIVEAKDHSDPWLKVAFHGRDAYVHGDFVAPVAAHGHREHDTHDADQPGARRPRGTDASSPSSTDAHSHPINLPPVTIRAAAPPKSPVAHTEVPEHRPRRMQSPRPATPLRRLRRRRRRPCLR